MSALLTLFSVLPSIHCMHPVLYASSGLLHLQTSLFTAIVEIAIINYAFSTKFNYSDLK